MSALGYGSTYMPSWRQDPASNTPNSDSENPRAVAPAMTQPNFSNQVADNPWAGSVADPRGGNLFNSPNMDPYGNQGSQIPGFNGLGNYTGSDKENFWIWKNPLNSLFQGNGNYLGLGGNPMQTGYNWTTGQTNLAPSNSRELYSQIGNLSMDQLMRMTGGGVGTLADKYSQAAHDFKNAYANGSYRAGAQLSEQENTDWLQRAYNATAKRLNDNYLL